MASQSRERGSMLPLVAGALALVLALSLAVSSATSLVIERHRLVALAESAALHAADSFDPARLRPGSDGLVVPLDSSRVRAATAEFLVSLPPTSHRGLRMVRADSPDGRHARVTLQSTWHAPLLSEWLPASMPIQATAQARSIIR